MSIPKSKIKTIKVKESDLNGKSYFRLDSFLTQKFPDLTRNYLQQVIKTGSVFVNKKKGKASKKIKSSDVIEINFPKPEKINLKPEKIALDVIHEDKNILVINKPAGLVVHPGAGNKSGTLVNALINYLPKLERIGSKLRPGIVHRLDKDTSGVMVVAKNDLAFQNLVNQFKEHQIRKDYLTLVYGKEKPKKGKIIAPINRDYHDRRKMTISGIGKGKEAETEYEVKEYFDGYTLLGVFPKTGRTHQIRVHLNSIGYPVIGDKTYRPKQNFANRARELGLTRQFLHADSISFVMPGGKNRKKFIAPLAGDLQEVLRQLKNKP